MGKYIAKRLGYMVVVALILSLLMFLVYTMIPYDRAVVEVDSYKSEEQPQRRRALREEAGREAP